MSKYDLNSSQRNMNENYMEDPSDSSKNVRHEENKKQQMLKETCWTEVEK